MDDRFHPSIVRLRTRPDPGREAASRRLERAWLAKPFECANCPNAVPAAGPKRATRSRQPGVWRREHGANPLAGAARKCTFCSHLLDVGVLPACVTTCIGGAMHFGDGSDPRSLVSEMTGGRSVFKGHENLGLKPRVTYFSEPMPSVPHIDCGACHDGRKL